MTFFKKPRFWVLAAVALVGLLTLQQFYRWEIERIEVPAGKFLVLVHRWGKDLPEDQLVAPDDSYKGVMLDVLPEGRHFINPMFWGHELGQMINVPAGECLVLTRKYGSKISKERLAAGEILAGDGEQGIVREVLLPGSYRLNSYAYASATVPAVQVRVDQVGVRTLKIGKDPRALFADSEHTLFVVPDQYRGVQQTPLPSGTYYVNPYVETITPVEVRSHRVELTDIEFPSRDGFLLQPHVLVEYAVQKEKAPELLVRLADEGTLHQEDATAAQQQQNEILQKIILPHIRGYARIEGSNFDARDFIVTDAAAADPSLRPRGEPPSPEAQPSPGLRAAAEKQLNTRELLQRALLKKVKPQCEDLGIEIRAVKLTSLVPPPELAEQISDRDQARVEQDRNKVRLGQYKAEQKLKAAEALKEQARDKVQAETRLVQAKTQSEQLVEVEESRLTQDLENAKVKLEAARQEAQAVLAQGKADAKVIALENDAEISGLRQAIAGFSSVQTFAQYHVLMRLGPALTEIFASDESDFAKLFAGYMNPPVIPGGTMPPVVPATAAGTPAARPTTQPDTLAPPRE